MLEPHSACRVARDRAIQRPRHVRHVLAPRNPSDPATLPNLVGRDCRVARDRAMQRRKRGSGCRSVSSRAPARAGRRWGEARGPDLPPRHALGPSAKGLRQPQPYQSLASLCHQPDPSQSSWHPFCRCTSPQTGQPRTIQPASHGAGLRLRTRTTCGGAPPAACQAVQGRLSAARPFLAAAATGLEKVIAATDPAKRERLRAWGQGRIRSVSGGAGGGGGGLLESRYPLAHHHHHYQANVLVPCAALKPGPAGPQGLVTMQA